MARNNVLVPESKKAMDAFKMEVANSLNVNLKQGYNGDLTSREAGSIGGEMVKRMIAYAENNMQNALPMMAMPKMVKARDIPTERLSASAIGGTMTELMP